MIAESHLLQLMSFLKFQQSNNGENKQNTKKKAMGEKHNLLFVIMFLLISYLVSWQRKKIEGLSQSQCKAFHLYKPRKCVEEMRGLETKEINNNIAD